MGETGLSANRKAGVYLLKVAGLAVVYFVTAAIGLRLDPFAGFATLVWPPAGIAFAALFIFGYRLWPAIFMSAFAVNWMQGAPVPAALGVSAGNTLEAVVGVYLFRRIWRNHDSLASLKAFVALLVFSAPISTMLGATAGVTSLSLAGLIPRSLYAETWRAWWIGDLLGDYVFVPLILSWRRSPKIFLSLRKSLEALLLIMILSASGILVFGNGIVHGVLQTPMAYLVFPPLIWAAFRFGIRAVVSANFAMFLFAVWGTVQGLGPFVQEDLGESLLVLQVFLGVVFITILLLAAVVADRKRAEEGLIIARNSLESRVLDRTGDLMKANRALQDEILERQKTEEALRRSAAEISDLYNKAPCGYHSLDKDGVFVRMNDTELHWLGYESDEIIGKKKVTDLLNEEGVKFFHDNFPAMKERGWINNIETQFRRKDGSWMHVLINAVAVKDEEGNFVMTRSTVFDMTERRKAEKRLLQRTLELARSKAEKDQLELFAYIASHDLQEPLQKIIAYGDLMKTHMISSMDEEGKNYLQRMENAATRMSQLIEDLFQFAKVMIRKEPLKEVDLGGVIREVINDLELRVRETHAEIKVGNLPVLKGDKMQVRELFVNLLTNALKFHRKETRPHIEIRALSFENGMAEISVSDDGIGIDQRYLNQIFKPFKRLHPRHEYEGTGMGLTICQRIVQRNGGKIRVESTPGQGTTFVVSLPAAELSGKA